MDEKTMKALYAEAAGEAALARQEAKAKDYCPNCWRELKKGHLGWCPTLTKR